MERVSHQFGKSPLYLSLLFLLFPPLASKQQHSCARIPRTAFLRLVLSAPLDAQQEPLSSHTQCVLPSKSFPSGERLSSFCLFQIYRSTCPTRSLHAPLQFRRMSNASTGDFPGRSTSEQPGLASKNIKFQLLFHPRQDRLCIFGAWLNAARDIIFSGIMDRLSLSCQLGV